MEFLGGRLEFTGARARFLLGTGPSTGGSPERTEGSGDEPRPLDEEDAHRIAARIRAESGIAPDAALAMANDLVAQARAALGKKDLSELEALALESVMYVRGRPALRVVGQAGQRLEALDHFPGSELWQMFVADFEGAITKAASGTGGLFVDAPVTGNTRWLQGTVWLIGSDRVVTNRHVLLSQTAERLINVGDSELDAKVRAGFHLDIEFAADDRSPAKPTPRQVKSVLYVSKESDPVDVAVLAIEPITELAPLKLAEAGEKPPENLFVVGHPGLSLYLPDDVRAVFGKPDGKKRVSFGKLMAVTQAGTEILHDASTVGGYSGAPVVGIRSGLVAGLHFYGDPASGNIAVSAGALGKHPVSKFLALPS
jgi:hypothetical protein